MTERTALIGIDWGTTAFRAYRIDASGVVRDRSESDRGIRNVAPDGFEMVLSEQIGAWIDAGGPCPVLMAGMVGSRQGWLETPYCPLPAGLDDIAAALMPVAEIRSCPVAIVPGVAVKDGAMPDVMRGEETQIFGALAERGRTGGRLVLPGTHSKWAGAEDGGIRHFATYMTGEIFAALCDHTILGSLMSEQDTFHAGGFERGLDEGHASGGPGALLHRVFGTRSRGLFGETEPEALSDYLSGMLIGAEFADAAGEDGEDITIIGRSGLAERYRIAAERFGLRADCVDPLCTAKGLFAIAARAGLIHS
jgi:2-dehydro-3-deoxygalactonokinase